VTATGARRCPIWQSDAPGSSYAECIGSVAELEEKVGRKLENPTCTAPMSTI
jgi:hypothetical protein